MANKKKEKIKIVCHICGKSFEVRPWRKYIAKYCSRECLAKVSSINMEKKRKKQVRRVEKVCQNKLCNKHFYVKPHLMKHKYCSNECYQETRTKEYHEKLQQLNKKQERININKIWGL